MRATHKWCYVYTLTGKQSRRGCSRDLVCPARAVTDLSWESPLRIIHYPDPRLRARNARIGVFDERLARLSRELFEVMYNGCAAAGPGAQQLVHLNNLLGCHEGSACSSYSAMRM